MIWKVKADLAILNLRGKETMSDYLGIEFIAWEEDSLIARMPISDRTKQPLGIMHGGASCVLAETVGSTAANLCVDLATHYCVGLDINTNHIRSVSKGFVKGTARPFHIGKSTQVWSIEIHNEEEKLISVTRLTMAVLEKK